MGGGKGLDSILSRRRDQESSITATCEPTYVFDIAFLSAVDCRILLTEHHKLRDLCRCVLVVDVCRMKNTVQVPQAIEAVDKIHLSTPGVTGQVTNDSEMTQTRALRMHYSACVS